MTELSDGPNQGVRGAQAEMQTKPIRLYRPDEYQRQAHDFYETPGWVTQCLLDTVPLPGTILEPCAGHGAMAKVIADAGHQVVASDLVQRDGSVFLVLGGVDALQAALPAGVESIVTNSTVRTVAAADTALARPAGAGRRDAVPAAAVAVGESASGQAMTTQHPAYAGRGAAAAPGPLVPQEGRRQLAAA